MLYTWVIYTHFPLLLVEISLNFAVVALMHIQYTTERVRRLASAATCTTAGSMRHHTRELEIIRKDKTDVEVGAAEVGDRLETR